MEPVTYYYRANKRAFAIVSNVENPTLPVLQKRNRRIYHACYNIGSIDSFADLLNQHALRSPWGMQYQNELPEGITPIRVDDESEEFPRPLEPDELETLRTKLSDLDSKLCEKIFSESA